jgi:hypothetical protein
MNVLLGNCSLVLRYSMRNVSRARRYTSLNVLLGNCSLVLRYSMRNVSRARRFKSLDLVLETAVLSLGAQSGIILVF